MASKNCGTILGSTPSIGLPSNPNLSRRLLPLTYVPPHLVRFTCIWLTLLLPQSKKANFDASHELEELLLEDNPLKAKARKNRDVSTLSVEMQQMEEQ